MIELSKAGDGWRDASKEQPAPGLRVLALTQAGTQAVGYCWTDGNWDVPGRMSKVTHWRELPEPPKGGEVAS